MYPRLKYYIGWWLGMTFLQLMRSAFLIWACMISQNLHVLVAASAASSSASCNYSAQICGGVPIPFPFGMTSECGLPDFRISCKLNPTYGADHEMPFLQVGTASTPELQVLNFSSTSNTMTVNSTQLKAMPNSSACRNPQQDGVAVLDLSPPGPFVLSEGNMFAVIGCNSRGSCVDSRSTSAERFNLECSLGCYNQNDSAFCNEYACCSNPVPPGSRYLKLTGNGISYMEFPGLCGFSTLLNPPTYSLAPNQHGFFGAGQYGMSISWALNLSASENCSTARITSDYACSDHAQCVYDSHVPGYTCNCSEKDGFRGDGYTHGIGCEDIDECKEGLDDCEGPPYGICTNTVGSYNCSCADGTTGSGKPGTCVAKSKAANNIALATILGGLSGAFFLTVLLIIVCVSRRAYRRKQKREENFLRNGGAELRSILFSEDELKRITKNFSHDHELGKGGYGTVYWGKLCPNNCKVAIKKAKHMEDAEREEEQMKSFVSEILLLGKTKHENVVRLLGCCVETRVPLLVYEFIENGTLWDHFHPSRPEERSSSVLWGSWARRLHIAVGTANALSYLHKTSPPILHRDIKSSNILIDKSYSAKVADFGASRFLTSGATHFTVAFVVGTHGYLDPEYHRSCQFTDKSDVYSFGVVLLELITAMPADLGTNLGLLAHHFLTHFKMQRHTDLIDYRLGTNADVLASIEDVAELAMECLAMEGSIRPTMEEVLRKLKRIQSKRGSLLLQDYEVPNVESSSTREGSSSTGTTSTYSASSAVHAQQITRAGDSELDRSLLGSSSSRQYSHLIPATPRRPSTSSEIALSSSSAWSS